MGMRIRLRRIQLDMSQDELGKALGVSFQQVQKYEKGMNRISGSRFLEICRVVKVDPNYLLGWEGKTLNADGVQMNDSVNLRTAQAIGLLPAKLRPPVQALIRSLGELLPADLK
jgi:transcriptional regulator with XRE-family HTH domain